MQPTQETTLTVTGMRCRSCVRHIDDALRRIPGVGGVEVDLAAGTVLVRHDPRAAAIDRLVAVLAEAGYRASARAAA